jgi:hypothetical protein
LKNQFNTSEKALLFALKNGDIKSFDMLFAEYGKRGTNNIANAAASALKLGLSLGDVGTISKSLLDTARLLVLKSMYLRR